MQTFGVSADNSLKRVRRLHGCRRSERECEVFHDAELDLQ